MVHKTGVHACPECQKTFSRVEYVTRHRRLKHLGLRPWSCACGASYGRSDLLSRHKRKCNVASAPAGQLKQWDNPSGSAPGSAIAPATDVLENVSKPTETVGSRQSSPYTGLPSYLEATACDRNPHLLARSSLVELGVGQQPQFNNVQTICPPPSNPSSFQGHRSPRIPNQYRFNTTLLNPLYPCSDSSTVPVADDGETRDAEPVDPAFCYGAPTSTIIRYSHPTFFISDVPESSPFYLNPDLWVLAFLCQRAQGFTIPHIGTLSRFVRTATEAMLPVIPMIHVPTLRTSMISIHLGYALAVAGAAAESSEVAVAFAEQSLMYKRPLVQKDFACRENSFDFRFELLQTLLTYQFLGIFNRLESQRNRAIRFGRTMIDNFRELGLAHIVRDAPDYVQLVLTGQLPLELGWRSWVKYEMHKRTVFLMLISSFQTSGSTGLELSDADIRLPCHEDLWTAQTAEAWIAAAQVHTSSATRLQADVGGSSSAVTIEPELMGEQAIPMLSDALAALDLGADCAMQTSWAGQKQVAACHERLGWFSKTIVQHARTLASQTLIQMPIAPYTFQNPSRTSHGLSPRQSQSYAAERGYFF